MRPDRERETAPRIRWTENRSLMAHLSWYRKYRPQTFDDVVGQSHIERTLRNAVAEGVVAHAYLFTGPRGTGKTTTARILAKALNCAEGPTPTPDDTCEQCRAIAEGTHPDVLELDAASRRGIDDVREQIIGRVQFAPSRGGWKVYIIDEVHMLTREAFNALLKTFEEPPANTVFVLATTDAHKVPDTIHSRCQRFDFRRLSVEDIAGRLRVIADAESVEVPDGALALIARHALGGMRDAITTLEQLASFGGGTIALADVEGLLGEVDNELLFQAADLVCVRDVAGAFRLVARLAETGVDMSEFVKGLVRHFRDLFVLSSVGDDGVVDVTSGDRGRLERQATEFGTDRIARVIDVLGRVTTELRYAADQRLTVEVALTRMARPQADLTLESLAERLDALEAGAPLSDIVSSAGPLPCVPDAMRSELRGTVNDEAASAAPGGAVSEGASSSPTPENAPDGPVPGAPAAPRRSSSAGLDVAAVKRAWPAILAEFKKHKKSRSHIFNGSEVEVTGSTLVVEFPADQGFALDLARDPDTISLLRRSVAAVLGVEPPIEYRLGRSGASAQPAQCAPVAPAVTHDGATIAPAPVTEPDDAGETIAPHPSELERMVIDELGAEVIEHHDNGPAE